MLADAFETKEYGSYIEKAGARSLREPICQVRGADGELRACVGGRAEFDAFVKQHMTQ